MRTTTPKKNGPAKTPTAILKKRGAWRAKERVEEPQPEPGIPDCPKSLKGAAKRVWVQMVKDLDAIGVLTAMDGKTLARYCRAWVQWEALASFDDTKLKIETVSDLKAIGQHADKMMKLSDHLLKFECQYGLTPASRPNIKRIEKPKDTDKAEDFFNKAG